MHLYSVQHVVLLEILFEFTIKQAEQFVKNRAVERMIEEFERINAKNLENQAKIANTEESINQ